MECLSVHACLNEITEDCIVMNIVGKIADFTSVWLREIFVFSINSQYVREVKMISRLSVHSKLPLSSSNVSGTFQRLILSSSCVFIIMHHVLRPGMFTTCVLRAGCTRVRPNAHVLFNRQVVHFIIFHTLISLASKTLRMSVFRAIDMRLNNSALAE